MEEMRSKSESHFNLEQERLWSALHEEKELYKRQAAYKLEQLEEERRRIED
jgi:hypothetical protein